MKKATKQFLTGLLSFIFVASGFLMSSHVAYAQENTAGLKFNTLMIKESDSGTVIADLLAGQTPELKAGTTYALDVEYSVPASLQFSPTYFKAYFGNGLYVKTLPGATFTPGHIESTGFEELTVSPSGTGTSPYGYPQAGSEKSRSGELEYKTKNSLTNVSSRNEICFTVDDAYLNQSTQQILTDVLKVSLRTDTTPDVDAHSYNVTSNQSYQYTFYTNQSTEVVSKGGETSTLNVQNVGGYSLTAAHSKTQVDIIYPSDIELVGLEDKALYHKNGTIVSTVENAGLKTSTVEWDEPGSYSSGLSFYPHVKVPSNSTRAKGSSFNVIIRNFKKTIWNDNPNVGRTSENTQAVMTVTIIDGQDPEKMTLHALVDSAPNWAFKKNDSYNVRLGSLLIKNELVTDTKAKTLEFDIDQSDTAIIRGVTIPWHSSMAYGQIHWTSADGRSGTADPNILQKSNVSALITNTALGLGINDSIKSVKIDLGVIPGRYDGVQPMRDLLVTSNPNAKYVSDEFYGWSYIPAGIYGSWKKGTQADVVSTAKLYTTGEQPSADETYTLIGKSVAPRVVNGVGSINKTQVLGGDGFTISGRIDDANWDWNPLQEPVLYMIMPEGFSYSNLQLTNGTLSSPEYVGEFEKDGVKVKAWKYSVDIGQETRGQYQPDFTSKNMNVSFDVKTDKRAKRGTYHINDFLGITTQDFAEIGAVIKAEKWDRSNWNTSKYTAAFGNAINSGKDMVSLSEGPGVAVSQAYGITAQAELLIPQTGKSYIYDATSEDSKTDTTPILGNGDKAVMRIRVRNNTTTAIDHATLFVPLLNQEANFGNAFMPEGVTKLPLQLDHVDVTDNFTVKYIHIKNGKQFAINTAPQPADYEEVTNPNDANMLMLVSQVAVAPDDGGRVDITYKVPEELTRSYNNLKDVITPVLDYDINGNKSTLTKEPAAVSFFTDKVETISIPVEKVWQDHDDEYGSRPQSVRISVYADDEKVAEHNFVEAEQWKHTFVDLPKIKDGNEIAYSVREESMSSYTATITGNQTQGFIVTNTYSVRPVTIKPTVKKVMQGNPEQNSTFTFHMKALNQNSPMPHSAVGSMATATVNGAGTSEFDTVTFTVPGTYKYEITEVNDHVTNYEYDTSVYLLTVHVTDVNGQLVAQKTIEKAGETSNDIVFTNTYRAPVNPTVPTNPSNPGTPSNPGKPVKPGTPVVTSPRKQPKATPKKSELAKTGVRIDAMVYVSVLLLMIVTVLKVVSVGINKRRQ
ncbi:Cna B-type domain-containing protein [Alloscardovia theropitheci]|uniref:Cna B-type domain-containing protein n=1 Tax=Alloscardovia theropitheci TaxID=2496842 RepID=A0A4R0R0D8_9BIFI|nr:Cna B-type domain-containing protein [Alloscardovia theropitheci]TCD54486.1 Cna B-type domain-containing protein [Alloscardovia theropitheci]